MKASVDVMLIEHGELKGLPSAVLFYNHPEGKNYSGEVIVGSLKRIADVVSSAKRRVVIKNVPEFEPKEMMELLKVVHWLAKEGFFIIFDHEGETRPFLSQFGGYCILHVKESTDTIVDEIHYWPSFDKWNMTEELPAFPGAKRRYVHTPGTEQSYSAQIAKVISATEEDWFFPDAV